MKKLEDVLFDDLKQLADPRVHIDGSIKAVPVECYPKWTKEMGQRLHRWRRHKCPKLDRVHWNRHEEANPWGDVCQCLSQPELAKRLKVSQAQVSKLETGSALVQPPSLSKLLSALGSDYGALLYVLMGKHRARFEAFAGGNWQKQLNKMQEEKPTV